ncbi:MAG TPA: tetraacyldisaccharide 4'-kinase [Gammaproteobacteria bacterium]|nr:tetraacyldisaccharide 4'-kinase [Gammaproteobacteria bacterium]
MFFAKSFEHSWYNNNTLTLMLRPLTWLYCAVIFVRHLVYRLGLRKRYRLKVPVIVVGNLSVGGTGKTPVVVHIAQMLKRSGYAPGIISRGYGGKARSWPQQVRPDADPVMVGDEAILISRRSGCPMAVGPNRGLTGELLQKHSGCDIIISDDGLQHYALERDVEIVVIDGMRRFGNGLCLPAGPLREPASKKEKVDFVITNGMAIRNEYAMRYQGEMLVNLNDSEKTCALSDLVGQSVHVLAGIGNPFRFFEQLRRKGLQVIEHPFSDHHLFSADDLLFDDDKPLLMTEKDAVKCQRFAGENMWYLPIKIEMNNDFDVQLLNLLEKK